MGIVIFVMGGVVAVFLAMLAGGLMLPARTAHTRTVRLRATPDVVWSLIADPAGYPAWQDAVSSVDIDGRAPLRWREYSDDGSVGFEAANVQPPHHFTVHSLGDEAKRRTERVFVLEAEDGGTLLTYTEQSSTPNPIARFIGRYVNKRRTSADLLLSELANALG